MRGALVRLQPDAVIDDGYDIRLLGAVAEAIGAPFGNYSRVLRIALDSNPEDEQLVKLLADALESASATADVVLVDMTFDPAIPRAVTNGDAWLSAALKTLAREQRAQSAAFLIMLESLPTLADSIYDVAESADYVGRIAFVNPAGTMTFEIREVKLTTLASVLRPAETPFTELSLGTLRQRGVFRSAYKDREAHYLFHYDVLKNAQDSLREILRRYLIDAGVDVVVFDSASASSWFRSSLAAACLRAGVGRVDVSSLTATDVPTQGDSESDSLARGRTALYDPASVVCYAVPAYESGSTLIRLHEQVNRDDWETAHFLTVYLKAERALEAKSSPDRALQWIARRRGQRDMRIDFVLQVPITMIPEGDWKLDAARLLGEVTSVTSDFHFGGGPGSRSLTPTRVGMWSLFERYGVNDEGPPASGRRPYRYFPNLRELDDEDAFWLAEAAIQTFQRDGTNAREQTLVVLPLERPPHEADSLHRALRRCGVSVLALPRAVIDGDEPLGEDAARQLDDFSDARIVVFDESTISHGTISRIASLIERTTRRPDHFLAIVDLSPPGASDISVVSFARWAPTETTPEGAHV